MSVRKEARLAQDPFENVTVRVQWDGRVIPGVSRVSGLGITTQVISHRDGGDPSVQRLSPGLSTFEPITLERGVTHDPAFEKWARQVAEASASNAPPDFRKEVTVELLNEYGAVVAAFRVFRAWAASYRFTAPALSGKGGADVAIEEITLACEGWERDYDVVEPVEPE